MAFSSFGFLLFVFVTLILYYALPQKIRWIVLLFASYAFYSFAGLKGLVHIFFITSASFFVARKMQAIQDKGDTKLAACEDKSQKKEIRSKIKTHKKRFCTLGIVLTFSVMVFLKYTPSRISADFFVPMGLSFYSFSVAGYLFDIYYGKYRAESNFFKYALFVGYFPSLVQGPISRENSLRHEFFEKEHNFDLTSFEFGLQRILWGFMKKLVIADRAFQVYDYIFNNYVSQSCFIILFGLFMYAIELYADFSGGMDVALGVSELFGIKLAENFRQPYFSTSIADFWRRWHITLGQWMKDYIFYPFSLSSSMQKFGKFLSSKNKRLARVLPMCLGNLVVFLLVGLWHGSEWHFIVYGILNGFVIAFSIFMEDYYKKATDLLHINVKSRCWKIFQIFRTFLITNIFFLFDEVKDLNQSFGMAKQLFNFSNFALFQNFSTESFDKFTISIVLIFSLLVFGVSLWKEQNKKSIRDHISTFPLVLRWAVYLFLIFAIPAFQAGDTTGFMYAKF